MFLIAGISWLAHVTHATPYTAGFPTVLAQEARLVFGPAPAGHVMFFGLQAATAAGGAYATLVVGLFAVVKFTEGAWLIVIIFPVLVYALIRLNRQYRKEAAEVRPARNNTMLACEVADSTGDLTALFYGRTHITGLEPGRRIRLHGVVGIGGDGRPIMVNPRYELLR